MVKCWIERWFEYVCISSGHRHRRVLRAAYFDASINRISAWAVGFRNVQKALLLALLTPDMTDLQNADRWTELMVRQEELKTMPFGDVWAEYCRVCGVPADGEWFSLAEEYERKVLVDRV